MFSGNEFSTLEGVEFQWSLSNWNSHQENSISNGSNVLQLITFRDSPYETPPTVQVFDSIGKHGHIVLLEGVKTGTAKVSGTPYCTHLSASHHEGRCCWSHWCTLLYKLCHGQASCCWVVHVDLWQSGSWENCFPSNSIFPAEEEGIWTYEGEWR